ncbi:hypothetical protein F5Y09DRAFT_236250 [Xylaria sp. FL1042]|nr:hypothetical protein F5Y09DRAFT_236250 [Xylaria sp. FL1042]
MEVQPRTQLLSIKEEKIKSTETQWMNEGEESMQESCRKGEDEQKITEGWEVTDSEEDDELISAQEAEPKVIEVKAVEAKKTEAKVMDKKPLLPFDPAKMRAATEAAAAARKLKGVKPAAPQPAPGPKPTSARKRPISSSSSTAEKPPAPKRTKKDPTFDDILSKARQWLMEGKSWMIRNRETGCFGMSIKHHEGERTEITIVHTVDCDCLDVRLLHICQHAARLVKKKQLARRSRDAFVIATKIRRELSLPVPEAVRFPAVRKQVVRRWKKEVAAEEKPIPVVDVHHLQRLVEKWKSLEAYKERRIWKDW